LILVKFVSHDAKLAEESQQKSIQVILKMPESFMRRFDHTCEQLGYTRTEAIREAMRRFQEQGEQRLMQRPETAAEAMKQMMSAIMTPILEMAQKTEEAEKLEKSRRLMALPDKKANG
jgi:metal-responsive CopG/Arc/MetJ family transcriptional regulator